MEHVQPRLSRCGKSRRQVRTAVSSATINAALLTAAERIQYEGYLRREDTNAAILKQAETDCSIKEIVRAHWT